MNGFNGNEPLSLDTKTHAVKRPTFSTEVPYDLDFTGLIIIGLEMGGADTSDFARLSLPNVFQRETTVSGFRLGDIKQVSANYTALPTDGIILVNCTGGDVTITLPPATGSGQMLRIKRLDDTPDNVAIIQPHLGDTIGAYSSLTLSGNNKATLIIDVLVHLWDLHIPPTLAFTDSENSFTQITNLSGVRLGISRTITTTNYTIQPTDFELLVDTSVNDADIEIFLPESDGNCRFLHFKKIDAAPHNVAIIAQDGENIDGADALNLGTQGADALLIAGAFQYWDIIGPTFANAMFLPFYGDKSRIMADGEFYLYNPDQGKFHTLGIRGTAGAEYPVIGAGVT